MSIRKLLSRTAGRAPTVGLALLLTALGPAPALRAQPADPVQELNAALLDSPPPTADEAALKKREAQLTELTNDKSQLRTLSQMAEALLLPNWSDYQTEQTDPDKPAVLTPASKVHREVRLALVRRMAAAARKEIAAADEARVPGLRAAVATFLGEFGASAQGGTFTAGAGRSNQTVIDGLPALAEPLAALAKADGSAEVRGAAARSLAKLRTAPDVTMAALTAMLKNPSPQVRRAGAAALSAILRGTPAADRSAGVASPITEPSADNLADFGPPVAKAAGAVLANREDDADVRRLCAAALLQTATVLNNQVRLGQTASDSSDRLRLGAKDAGDWYGKLRPVAMALWDQTPPLGRAAADADPRVRFTALRTLEEMGDARTNWVHPALLSSSPDRMPERVTPTPVPAPLPKPPVRPKAAAPEELRGISLVYAVEQAQPPAFEPPPLGAAIPALVSGLEDPEVRNRLTAIDGLEAITRHTPEESVAKLFGPRAAAQAAKALERALSDRDRFVRWAAARTLGGMAPLDSVEDGKRVEYGALAGLARLMYDADPDVRIRAARALERFGPAAQVAIPALARGATHGDNDTRLAATHAILAIGGNPEAAVPALAAGLTSQSVQLRRAVAEALVKYGPEAVAARPALERALADTDPEVRRLAAEALLKIGTTR
jgi:HEAT repeat protein